MNYQMKRLEENVKANGSMVNKRRRRGENLGGEIGEIFRANREEIWEEGIRERAQR